MESLHVFRGPISSEWQQRLPNLVRRLEEALFKEAVSKEEYMNLNTLELRLQSLMKRFHHNNRNQNLSHHNPHVGTMIPTPGLQQSGHVNAMIPTPGTDISTVNGPGTSTFVPNTVGMGNVISNSNENASLLLATDNNSSKMVPTPGLSSNFFPISCDNMSSLPGPLNNAFQSQQSISTGTGSMMPAIGLAQVPSQMIPTPGLNTTHSMSMSSACSVGLGHSNVDSLTAAQHQLQQQKQLQQQQQLYQQQLQFSGGQNNRIYHNMNGQMGGTIGINMPQKNSSYGLLNGGVNNGMQLMSDNQHFMNGTTPHPNTGSYITTSRYGTLQVPSQQLNQRQRHLMQPLSHQMNPLVSDGYAMNVADLAGPGNLYNPVTSGGVAAASNFNSNSLGLQ